MEVMLPIVLVFIKSLIFTITGLNLEAWFTPMNFLDFLAALTSFLISLEFRPAGFSCNRCLLCFMVERAVFKCRWLGVGLQTKSTSGFLIRSW